MTPCTRGTLLIITLTLYMALPARGQQYLLYAPQPAPSGQRVPAQEGILVQEIEIQKGDTLYGLSRKFNGRGMYYPQILLFNSIKNPNLIYTGNTLKMPLAHKESHGSGKTDSTSTGAAHTPKISDDKKTPPPSEIQPPARQSTGSSPTTSRDTELSLNDLKRTGAGKIGASRPRKKSATPAKIRQPLEYPVALDPAAQKSASIPSPEAVGQKLFESAVTSYHRGNYRTALEQFDRYLADNSGSPLAADANLYKAECYLKLSAQ